MSTGGFALGYLGGGVLLALNVAWILSPATFGLRDAAQASRLSFASVALWWFLFSIPLFRRVPEPTIRAGASTRSTVELIRTSFAGLLTPSRPSAISNAMLLLIAFVFYADGIGTIQRLATIMVHLGIDQCSLITASSCSVAGIPFAFLFECSRAASVLKRHLLGLAVYIVLTVGAYYMKTERDFYVLALMVATVQGGTQALSRSLFASMIPKARSSEFFGFFSIFEKFGAILGPAVFEMASRTTGSSRSAILSVVVFFLAGAVLSS